MHVSVRAQARAHEHVRVPPIPSSLFPRLRHPISSNPHSPSRKEMMVDHTGWVRAVGATSRIMLSKHQRHIRNDPTQQYSGLQAGSAHASLHTEHIIRLHEV